jgi:molecular chaperone GrpE
LTLLELFDIFEEIIYIKIMEDETKNNKIDESDKTKELSPEELKKNLEECIKEKDEYLAGWQRTKADFLNYKKEQAKMIEEVLKFANLDLIIKLLPILDNFDLIEKKLPEELKKDENIKGILQIRIQILEFLRGQELEEIKTIGEKFNPNFHEAIEIQEMEGKESDIIIEEIQKGYILKGRVIQPAKVKIVK